MAAWSDISLDFAIGGIDTCGTTALRLELQRHPELVLTTKMEGPDYWWTNEMAHRLLPLRRHVEAYNQQIEALKGSREALVGAGIPSLFALGLARQKLAQVKAKVLLIFCRSEGQSIAS